jgi:hypothetical protein
MYLAPLPFDYAVLLDPGDRLRRTRKRATGSRTRRLAGRPSQD